MANFDKTLISQNMCNFDPVEVRWPFPSLRSTQIIMGTPVIFLLTKG